MLHPNRFSVKLSWSICPDVFLAEPSMHKRYFGCANSVCKPAATDNGTIGMWIQPFRLGQFFPEPGQCEIVTLSGLCRVRKVQLYTPLSAAPASMGMFSLLSGRFFRGSCSTGRRAQKNLTGQMEILSCWFDHSNPLLGVSLLLYHA